MYQVKEFVGIGGLYDCSGLCYFGNCSEKLEKGWTAKFFKNSVEKGTRKEIEKDN